MKEIAKVLGKAGGEEAFRKRPKMVLGACLAVVVLFQGTPAFAQEQKNVGEGGAQHGISASSLNSEPKSATLSLPQVLNEADRERYRKIFAYS